MTHVYGNAVSQDFKDAIYNQVSQMNRNLAANRHPPVTCPRCESKNVHPTDDAPDYEAYVCVACLKGWGRCK